MGDVVLNTSDLALGLQYQRAAWSTTPGPTLGSSCALKRVERIVLAGTPLIKQYGMQGQQEIDWFPKILEHPT